MKSHEMQRGGPADGASLMTLARAHASRPYFESEQRFEERQIPARRSIYVKWLTALLVMATAAFLVVGAVWTSIRSEPSVVIGPPAFDGAATEVELQRADRLTMLERSPEIGFELIRTQLEQLGEDGKGTKAFTHLLTRLAPPAKSKDVGELKSGPAVPPKRVATTTTPVGSEVLPDEIRFGVSKPESHLQLSAYAASNEPSLRTQPDGVEINRTVIAKTTGAPSAERHIVVARAGDTLESILTALGATLQDARAIAALLTPHSLFGRNSFNGGETISVLKNRAQVGETARPWQVVLAGDGKPARVAALSDSGAYVSVLSHPYTATFPPSERQSDVPPVPWEGISQSGMNLKESLLRLSQDSKVAHSLIEDILQFCAKDVNLEAPVASADTAEFLYSSSADGEPKVVFAALKLNNRIHRFYRFTAPDDGHTDYYDADGHSVTTSLSHKPVANGRLGDGFGWRLHPILRDRRFHEGTDYAAPFGSPIAAAGAGVVEKIDQQWGYGKYVRIRHDFGYETTYAHISGVPNGLKVGARIHPGQTIAYVGSTGLSTGPHLYYELRVNGHYADPLQTHLRAGRVLSGEVLAAFQEVRARTDALLSANVH